MKIEGGESLWSTKVKVVDALVCDPHSPTPLISSDWNINDSCWTKLGKYLSDCGVLASEVTPGLLIGVEPNAHQFYVSICLMG